MNPAKTENEQTNGGNAEPNDYVGHESQHREGEARKRGHDDVVAASSEEEPTSRAHVADTLVEKPPSPKPPTDQLQIKRIATSGAPELEPFTLRCSD